MKTGEETGRNAQTLLLVNGNQELAGKIHALIYPARILTQRSFDNADGFYKFAPVDCAQGAQTMNAVRNGNLIGRLLLKSPSCRIN